MSTALILRLRELAWLMRSGRCRHYAWAEVAEIAAEALALARDQQHQADAERFVWNVRDGAFDGLIIDHYKLTGDVDLPHPESSDYMDMARAAIDVARKSR